MSASATPSGGQSNGSQHVDTPNRRNRDSSEEVQGSAKKKQKVSHYPAMFDVVDDPKGDLVIQVGVEGDLGLVRVHKMVLVVSSAVFKTMLAGNFAEAGRQYTEESPLVLEDDRTAFIDFCLTIHNQSKDSNRVPLSRAAPVAVVFDKYCCSHLLLQNAAWPLREYFGRSVDKTYAEELKGIGLRVEDVLCISYVADDAKLFSRCTRFMISRVTPDRGMKNMKTDKALLALMPQSLVDGLQRERSRILDRLDDDIFTVIQKIPCLYDDEIDNLTNCALLQMSVALVTVTLASIKDSSRWSAASISIDSAVSKLDNITAAVEKMRESYPGNCRCGIVGHESCTEFITSYIEAAHHKCQFALEQAGLCLKCVKAGMSSGCTQELER